MDSAQVTNPPIGTTIRLLGDLLGQIIVEQSGETMFELVEEIRTLSKQCRLGDNSAIQRLGQIMHELADDLPRAAVIVKAFSTYFRLINLAEEHQRVNVLSNRENVAFQKNNPMDESIQAAIETLKSEGLQASDLQETIGKLFISPVFTAHPTESRRKAVRQNLNRISNLLNEIQSEATLEFQKPDLMYQLKSHIVLLWQSDETRNRRPTVMDEVRNTGLYFFEETLFDVVPEIYREMENALSASFPEKEFVVPPFLKYGSWIGGDRDGNPLVTANVTENALQAHKELAIERYQRDVFELYELLSVSLNRVTCDAAFTEQLKGEIDTLDDQSREILDRFRTEPYRQKLILIYRKLQRTRQANQTDWNRLDTKGYTDATNFLNELISIRDSLIRHKGKSLVGGKLEALIRRVQVFGFHLATLDVRQHSSRHRQAIADILGRFEISSDYANLDNPTRSQMLMELIASKRPLTAEINFDESTNEVLETFRLIARAQKCLGQESMQTYVISMTESESNVLEVLLLLKDSGLHGKMDIVPLFETVDDLLNADKTMAQLFANDAYRRHLAARNNQQLIMIGYSDSNKDGGYLRANWMLFTAQRALAAQCQSDGIQLTLFHGRGGSLGRGGGPANRAILSQPPESVDGRIRVTEQGEVVSSRYSNQGIARRHLQQLVHASICSTGKRPHYNDLQRWNEVMDELSSMAYHKYRELVGHPSFIDYFQSATPVELVEHLNIGSRPSRRKASKSIDDLRAIPWVFSWTQSRANIASWFGIGSAVNQWCSDNGSLQELQAMYSKWQFFKTLFNNVHVGLGRADMGIAELYSRLAVNDSQKIFNVINDEFRLTADRVLEVTGHDCLLDTEPWLQHSIRVRNPYVDPLNHIQVALLERLRDDPKLPEGEKTELIRLLADSVNGIAAGLQNVG